METSLEPIVLDMETARRVLTQENCRLISIILTQRPLSIGALCQLSGRAQPNISRALAALAEAGVVRMVGSRPKRPELVAGIIAINIADN